jgi:hypothetical protein
MVRMNTVRNDVAHFQIFTGSYPTVYWIPAEDKSEVVRAARACAAANVHCKGAAANVHRAARWPCV